MESESEEEKKQLVALIEKANKQNPKAWSPKENEAYYYHDTLGNVSEVHWWYDDFDRERYAIGNCFKTKKEAEWHEKHLRVKAELKRFAEEHNEHKIDNNKDECRWMIRCTLDGNISTFVLHDILSADTVYFTSSDTANAAIKEIGEERLKKYYFGVEG